MAFVYCRPRRYDGPVTILSSTTRPRAFRAGFGLRNLLPQVRIEPVTKVHRDIIGAEAARAMQQVFDAALKTESQVAEPVPKRA
jgi:hypothetical protein